MARQTVHEQKQTVHEQWTHAALTVQAATRRRQHDNPKAKGSGGKGKGKASGASALMPLQLEAQRLAADSKRRQDALATAHKHALGQALERKGALASGSRAECALRI